MWTCHSTGISRPTLSLFNWRDPPLLPCLLTKSNIFCRKLRKLSIDWWNAGIVSRNMFYSVVCRYKIVLPHSIVGLGNGAPGEHRGSEASWFTGVEVFVFTMESTLATFLMEDFLRWHIWLQKWTTFPLKTKLQKLGQSEKYFIV